MTDDYILNAVREFMATLVSATDEQLDAATALLAVTHVVDAFTTVPRGLVVSDEPSSGKTTLGIDIPSMLAFNGWDADPTEYALKAKYSEPKRVTLLMDEISKIFGESGLGGRQNKIYKILVEGYRNTATVSMAVNRVSTDVSTYGVAYMTGLRTACPPDLRSRSIVFNMHQAPIATELRDALDPSVRAEGAVLNEALHAWCALTRDAMDAFALDGLRNIHPKLTGRKRQVWGSLFAVANAAGGTWPARILSAFRSLALDASERPVLTIQQQVLLDTAGVLTKHGLSQIFTADLIAELRAMPEREVYRKMSTEYLQLKLVSALGESETIRGTNLTGQSGKAKGRRTAPILEAASALQRSLNPPAPVEEPDLVAEEMAFEPDGPTAVSA